MREILFRGKCKETGKWYTGQYINLHKTTYCFKEDYEADKDNELHHIVFQEMTDWGLPNRHLRVDVIPETVGQYTGLTDKNGTKIFEGDIIKTRSGGLRFVIKYGAYIPSGYCKEMFSQYEIIGFYAFDGKGDFQLSNYPQMFEVVGNIHDNPELLEVAE